jgi:hypothetical protein
MGVPRLDTRVYDRRMHLRLFLIASAIVLLVMLYLSFFRLDGESEAPGAYADPAAHQRVASHIL